MVPQCHLEVGLVSVPGRRPNYLCDGSSTPAPQQRGGSCLLIPLPCQHQLCLRCARHTLPCRLRQRKSSPWRRVLSWEPPGAKILAEGGSFSLSVRMGAAFSVLRSGGNVGQVPALADAAALSARHPLWMAVPPAPPAARTGDEPEAISPLGYGRLKEVPTAGRSGTGTQLGTWTRLVPHAALHAFPGIEWSSQTFTSLTCPEGHPCGIMGGCSESRRGHSGERRKTLLSQEAAVAQAAPRSREAAPGGHLGPTWSSTATQLLMGPVLS